MKTTEHKIKQEKHDAEYALKKSGLVKTAFAGWVDKTRLEFCLKNGYLKKETAKIRNKNRSFAGFTKKALDVGFMNIIAYLHKDIDYLV